MRKISVSMVLIIYLFASLCLPAFADEGDWKTKPVITSLYEIEKGKLSIEWEGAASHYRVYIDDNVEAKTQNKNTIIALKEGVHQINIVPFKYEPDESNASFSLDLGQFGGGSLELGSVGKDTIYGTPSDTFRLDYSTNPIMDATPTVKEAVTDFQDKVILSITDKYDADIYRVFITSGKDTTHVDFDITSEEASRFIQKENSSVTIVLDQDYLKKHECMRPELGQKYSFSVKLRKWPIDKISGAQEKAAMLESKESKKYDFTPYAAWKEAPVITYHSQTADGQITLQWEHDDNDLGCKYKIIKLDKLLVVKKGQEEVGITDDDEFVVRDLMNGKHTFSVVPVLGKEEGNASEEITEEIKNEWVVAPELECEVTEANTIELDWCSSKGVESYHITVYTGSGSVLRFVNLDFNKYAEFDMPVEDGDMRFLYKYDGVTDAENGVRLKFEIYGIRHTASGEEQKSAVSSQTVVLK